MQSHKRHQLLEYGMQGGCECQFLGSFPPLLVVCPFSKPLGRVLFQSWARWQLRLFGISVSLQDENPGSDREGPKLYVWLNQSNLVEGRVIGFLLAPGFVVINVECALIPLTGFARVCLGDIEINRQWKKQARRGITRAAERLAATAPGIISIEGARSVDGRLLPYKKGPAVLAIKAQATIIPVVMSGGRDVLPAGTWKVRPGKIGLHCLTAIPTEGLTYEDREAVVEQLRGIADQGLS
ncbi:MAG: lysophospholipid acyltransferase family protein [Candidatus Reddybacter sp.]